MFSGDGLIIKRGLVCVLVVACCPAFVIPSVASEDVDYNRDIRPLLSDRCFQCHGPDEEHREAGLRLDDRTVATSEADSGYTAIIPGDADGSEMVARITARDRDLLMPPPESGKSLSEDEIKLLVQWIRQGAEYEPHWAFVAPSRIKPPIATDSDWPQAPIDEFVLAEMRKHGLSPSPPADKVTLLRRVFLDLIGLPPTPEERSAFLEDNSPDAFEHVVDRLLDSPRYGEHMARYWLDAVRYGDTNGLHLDNYREMWPYRDWVVRAFNANVPWDELTVMQIAGDLRPNATLDDQIASGFNRCHVTTNEGGSIDEEVHVRNVVDRVSTTGTVYLGLTMGCAVCHDHKFDPVSARDFYSMYAFFNNLDGKAMDGNLADHQPTVKAATPEQTQELEQLNTQLAEVEAQLASPLPRVDELQTQWELQLHDDLVSRKSPSVSGGQWYSVGPFRSDFRSLYSDKHGPEGKAFDIDQTFSTSDGETIGWQRQPDWTDSEMHYELSQKVAATFLYRTIRSSKAQKVNIGLGTDDGVKVYLNGKMVHQSRQARSLTVDADKLSLPLKEGDNELMLKVINHGGRSGFVFTMEQSQDKLPAGIRGIVFTDPSKRTTEQAAQLQQYFRRQVCDDHHLGQTLQEADDIKGRVLKLEAEIPTTLVMRERSDPRPAYLLVRGQYDAPDKELGALPRAVPHFLPSLPDEAPSNRLGLAQWLIDEQNPLMARVTVNRFWQQCFGIGLVETSDDFGSQGSWPSHPELLDWLAVDFRDNGWDVKRLMKQLVMTSAYQQSSKSTEKHQSIDPRNRLLARGPRFRLDAEVIRDQALAVSALLVNKLGGPGVKPPQPDGLWNAVAYTKSNTSKFVADTGRDKVHRRSIYTFWKRTAPPPQFSTLDAPSRESCMVRRERTNTPLAALLLLNDPQFVEAARALARRSMLERGDSPRSVARRMLTVATLREPTEREVERLVDVFEKSLRQYQGDPEATEKLLGVGEVPYDDQLDQAEVAAWTLAANVVLNLDELLNKE